MKPTLKAPGIDRLKQSYVKLLSKFAFKFNLRRYTKATTMTAGMAMPAHSRRPTSAPRRPTSTSPHLQHVPEAEPGQQFHFQLNLSCFQLHLHRFMLSLSRFRLNLNRFQLNLSRYQLNLNRFQLY
jgi:hypothetical protein